MTPPPPPLQFMKLLMTVSGKDMSSFLEQWVCSSGVPRLQASYTFVRKKNFVELKVKQMVPHRSSKFAVSTIEGDEWVVRMYVCTYRAVCRNFSRGGQIWGMDKRGGGGSLCDSTYHILCWKDGQISQSTYIFCYFGYGHVTQSSYLVI